MRKLTLEQFQAQINKQYPREQLQALTYDGDDKPAQVKCLTCGTIYTKTAGLYKNHRVSICKECFPTQPNIKKTNYKPPEGYELVGPYNGMQHKTLVRHIDCGFIWEVKPNNLEFGKGCPICNRKVPKGEQRISKWLRSHNINYIAQYPIDLEEHHLSIDFYLPDLDLYIEYNGEQHYYPVAYFGGEEKFNKQQELDALKVKYLNKKLLIISYEDFENIESILESSTTIPQGSTS